MPQAAGSKDPSNGRGDCASNVLWVEAATSGHKAHWVGYSSVIAGIKDSFDLGKAAPDGVGIEGAERQDGGEIRKEKNTDRLHH